MTQLERPQLPIPAPLRGADAGSFAHNTVAARLPDIARRVLAENDFSPAIVGNLEKFIGELPDGLIRPLTDTTAPDTADWQSYVTPYLEHNWLQAPWFFAETYFYRRILEATGYFRPGAGQGVDPYAYQKRQGLATTRAAIRVLSRQVNEWLKLDNEKRETFGRLLAIDLWGNQADLSLWPADEAGQPTHTDERKQQAHLLVDDTTAVTGHLFNPRDQPTRVDFLADNAGFELVCDLCLADFLLSSGTADTVHFHLKIHPTFVSDATMVDVEQTVAFLAADSDTGTGILGRRLQAHGRDGRLRLRQHPFWTSPLAAWEMPPALRQELRQSRLVVSKGDANYRRLLGDRHWPYTTPFTGILSYFPAPLVALRTLKSEVAAGLQPAQLEELPPRDPYWLTNGQWGVIQATSQGTLNGE